MLVVVASEFTHARLVRVLIAGFSLVILLLLTAGFVGLRNIQSIRENARRLVSEQQVTGRLVDELQHQQESLSAVFYSLARDPDFIDSDKILAQLDASDRDIDRIAAEYGEGPQRSLWQTLRVTSRGFSGEARRLLSVEEPESFASRDLFHRHEAVTAVFARLIGINFQNIAAARTQIDASSARFLRESVLLLGGCLLLAVGGMLLTVKLVAQLFHRMEYQAGELSRVSWHMLENQETTARRFSHELHDELGQSLTAVKANLMAVASTQDGRISDCIKLVDEAIQNVRQLSQLLRPTILDDFGLEAGLRWLSEGFTQRTGIEVRFTGALSQRPVEETETHLFRIAQEALTNIARHSGATSAAIDLRVEKDQIRLSISDNGRGIPGDTSGGGMGITGMRARARHSGGDMEIRQNGNGTCIEVRVPARMTYEQNPHLAS